LNNNKQALIYGFDENETEKINRIAKENHFPFIKTIKNTMGKMRVSEILSGDIFEVCNCYLSSDKVILFNNFCDDELSKAIQFLREDFQQMPIMAVVTETSMNWTFEKLLTHLIEEKEWARVHNR
jgi:hypothetical protein